MSIKLFSGFFKTAKLKTELLPHQQRVVDRIQKEDQPGLVVVHGLGSGKTLTSIAAQDALKAPASVVVPASLRANYTKERTKHLSGKKQPIKLDSIQNVAAKQKVPDGKLLVVDEAHRARDPSSKTYHALAENMADKRLLLTGSPFYNHPSDVAPLINLAAGDRVLPQSKEDFTKAFIRERQVSPGFFGRLRGVKPGVVEELNPKRSKELSGTFSKWIDYHPGSQEGFPEVTREDVQVPMTRDQLRVYDAFMGQAAPWFKAKVKKGLPPSKQEAKQLNAFANAVRQVSNTTEGYQPGMAPQAPKIEAAFTRLQQHLQENPNARAVVYSNYLDSGINPYKKRLEEAGVPFGEFTGQMNHSQRDQMVRDYNEGKLKTLLLSSAGGEGLDLKGTSLMQLLEPHWNLERLKQVEGRGARFKSHDHLPEEERKLRIERYLATRPRSGVLERLHLAKPGYGIDEYLQRLSGDKEKLIEQFRGLLPQHEETP